MPRKWKNSDDNTYYVDRSIEARLERIRCDVIKDYSKKKFQKNNKKNNGGYKKGRG